MRVFFVCDILVVDQAAGQPEAPVLRLKNLEIRIIPFVVPFVVAAAGFFPDAASVGEFQKEGVTHCGPDVALRVRVQRTDIPAGRLPVGAGNDGSDMPDRSLVMPDLLGHLYPEPLRAPYPQPARLIHREGIHPAILLPVLEAHAVKAGQSVPGANPQRALCILRDRVHRVGRQSVRRAVVHKAGCRAILGEEGPTRQQQGHPQYDGKMAHSDTKIPFPPEKTLQIGSPVAESTTRHSPLCLKHTHPTQNHFQDRPLCFKHPSHTPLKHAHPFQNHFQGRPLCFKHPSHTPLKHAHPFQNHFQGRPLCFKHPSHTPLKHAHPNQNTL